MQFVRPLAMLCRSSTDGLHTRGLVQDDRYFFKKDLLLCFTFSKEVWSSLRETAWTEELAGHPDKCFAEYILQGIQEGFRIGHDVLHYLIIMSATSNLSINNPQ